MEEVDAELQRRQVGVQKQLRSLVESGRMAPQFAYAKATEVQHVCLTFYTAWQGLMYEDLPPASSA
jgi:hypothetical protein